MYRYLPIRRVHAREVLDSRSNPTVEVEVTVGEGIIGIDGYTGRAIVPSGASTGKYEAVELRDGEERFLGRGVQKAVENVNTRLCDRIVGENALNQAYLDQLLCEEDGTENKGRLGANATLGISLAVAKASACALRLPLYQYLGGIDSTRMPVPMMNILNGGAHADNTVDTQEFMIMPIGACCFKEAVRMCSEVYHKLGENLKKKHFSTSVGDEGGYAPALNSDEEAIDCILTAIHQAGYSVGTKVEGFLEHYEENRGDIGTRIQKDVGVVEGVSKGDFMIALDAAASEWKSEKGKGYYQLPKSGKCYTTDELIAHWKELIEKYPIISIEDPLDEEDWEGWKKITRELGDRVQLVGDDLFVTNTSRLKRGIEEGCGNAILIKPNQIGTLSETIEAITMAHKAGFRAIVSHRSGETEDTTIADLVVGMNTGQIKTGAPCRGERTAKYNQLLRIEEELGESARYMGWDNL